MKTDTHILFGISAFIIVEQHLRGDNLPLNSLSGDDEGQQFNKGKVKRNGCGRELRVEEGRERGKGKEDGKRRINTSKGSEEDGRERRVKGKQR